MAILFAGLAGVGAFASVGILLDFLAEIEAGLRLIPLLGAGLSLLYGVVGSVLGFLCRVPAEDSVASKLDRSQDAKGAVRSAVDFIRKMDGGMEVGHPFLVERTVRTAQQIAERAEIHRIVRLRRVWRRAFFVLLPLLVVGGMRLVPGMPIGLLLARFINPFGNYPRPSLTKIELNVPPTIELEEGRDLIIEAELGGRIPSEPACLLQLEGKGQIPMQPLPGNRFRARLRNVRKDFSFYVSAGDARTKRHDLRVLVAPRIISLLARYEPPRYSRLKPHSEEVKYRELRALAGTAVSLEFRLDRPLSRGHAVLELSSRGGQRLPESQHRAERPTALEHFLKLQAKKTAESRGTQKLTLPFSWDRSKLTGRTRLIIQQSGLLRFVLTGENGVTNKFEPGYRITAIPDNPPTVTITNLPEELTLRMDDVLRVHYIARDDIGLADLRYTASPQHAKTAEEMQSEFVPLERFGEKEVEGEVAISASELAPLDKYTPAGGHRDILIAFYLTATDTKGQESVSRRVQITILRETYDREIEILLQLLRDCVAASERNRRLLISAINSLVILLDTVESGGRWTKKEQEKLNSIVSSLRFRLFYDHYARMRFEASRYTLFPYRAQRFADILLTMHLYQLKDFSAIGNLAGDTELLKQALGTLKWQREFIQDFQRALNSTIAVLSADTILYLVELIRRENDSTPEHETEYSELLKSTQSARAGKLLSLIKELPFAKELSYITDPLAEAQRNSDLDSIALLSSQLRAEILKPGRLAIITNHALAEFRKKYSPATLLRRSLAEAKFVRNSLDLLRQVYSAHLEFSSDTQLTDEPALALLSLALLKLLQNKTGGLDKLLASHKTDSLSYLVSSHINYAYHQAISLFNGVSSGRLTPRSPDAERTWGRLRDTLLVLLDSLEELSPAFKPEICSELGRLRHFRRTLLRWDIDRIALDSEDRAKLEELIKLLASLRRQTSDFTLSLQAESLFREGVLELNALFERELKDALEQIARLQKERRDPPRAVSSNKPPPTSATSEFGEKKEQSLLLYSRAYRKFLDLLESDYIPLRKLSPEFSTQAFAVHKFLEWLPLRVATSFGRYERRSMVRRKIHTPEAFLTKMKDYPAHLREAGLALRSLAIHPGKPSHAIDYLISTSRSRLDLEEYDRFFRELLSTAAVSDRSRLLLQLFDQRLTGSFIAENLIVPLRRLIKALEEKASPPVLNEALVSCDHTLPMLNTLSDRVQGLEDLRHGLNTLSSYAGKPLPEELRQEVLASVGNFLSALSVRAEQPPIRTKFTKRLFKFVQLQERFVSCRERTAMFWQREVERHRRSYLRDRVDLLLFSRLSLAELYFQFAQWRIAMRKSAGIARESGSTLEIKIPGIRYDLLNMPKYLYDELLRARAEPYPQQFKEPALHYIGGLIRDAKK